jgi:hypothetical protein
MSLFISLQFLQFLMFNTVSSFKLHLYIILLINNNSDLSLVCLVQYYIFGGIFFLHFISDRLKRLNRSLNTVLLFYTSSRFSRMLKSWSVCFRRVHVLVDTTCELLILFVTRVRMLRPTSREECMLNMALNVRAISGWRNAYIGGLRAELQKCRNFKPMSALRLTTALFSTRTITFVIKNGRKHTQRIPIKMPTVTRIFLS